ncbi:venom carboxylesterase-6-like [Planococcus citri]|uniref:venom carboxylesterase-6-like n=1 Tax=Planococcus citri TaxID=170843 RepID=UPI0031F76D02
MNVVFCVLFSLITCTWCELLTLRSGTINGTVGKSKNGRSFHQFYSIPYAEPPVGELRFKAPIAAKSWSEIRDGSKLPPRCIQPPSFITPRGSGEMKEDCLYLNVFVPSDLFKPSGKAAVMVWIHGGSYQIGVSSDYNPEYFMDKNVIFVTVNYRLGVLGFLGLNDDVISGNFGLKDQALALQWIRENIAVFGGDPDKVTLMGESAGSASVHLHMFSPLSKGLFQKVILQSGSAFSDWAVSDSGFGESLSITFLVVSGCWRNDSVRILKCLQHLPVDDFLTLRSKSVPRYATEYGVLFKPIIESNVKNQSFLPRKIDKSTYQSNVPWITGINSGEGAMALMSLVKKGGLLENVTKVETKSLAPFLGRYLFSLAPENIEYAAQKIINFYFSSQDAETNKALKFVDIFTDYAFFYPFVKAVQSNGEQQYVYYYDHRGSFSWQDYVKLDIDLGVAHADEIPILFRRKNLEEKWTPGDCVVSETLIKFWTEFSRTGDPNGESEEKVWKPTSSEGVIEYLHIKSNSTIMEKNLLKERYDFWESLKAELNERIK